MTLPLTLTLTRLQALDYGLIDKVITGDGS